MVDTIQTAKVRISDRLSLLMLVSASLFYGCDATESTLESEGGAHLAGMHAGAEAGEGGVTSAGAQTGGEAGGSAEAGAEVMTELLDPEGVPAGPVDPLTLQESRTVAFTAFTTSPACALCHSNSPQATAMRDSEGEEIAPFNLWQGSMMANSSRDPFWWAQVSAEVKQNPEAQASVEGECVRCHAPMLSESARARANREGTMSDLKNSTEPAALGLDGVACTTCHQILPDNLGTTASFSGGFEIGQERQIFGPHRNPATAPMRNHVNYTPTYGDHVREAAMCATCHTLLHPLSEEDGGGYFAEQTPYLEWKNSVYNNELESASPDAVSCQGCHVPVFDDQGVELRTRIARSPPGGDFRINPRSPFGQHLFIGANTVIPQILKAERATLKPQASDEALDRTTQLGEDRLASAVELTVSAPMIGEREGQVTLNFDVTVSSFAGHKVPTGFPARRAWLLIELTSPEGEPLLVSGSYDSEGRILSSRGGVLDSEKTFGPVEPHHALITSLDQVQVYEAVMRGADGQPTTYLTQAKGWLKDNRLLPIGYNPNHPEAGYTNPVGVEGDDTFTAGGDVTRYELPLPSDLEVSGATLTVRLVYQTLGARFMRGLFQSDTPEVAAFKTMYQRADTRPNLMATASVAVEAP